MLETEGYGEEDPQGATGQLRNSTAGHKPQAPPWHRHRDPVARCFSRAEGVGPARHGLSRCPTPPSSKPLRAKLR